MNNLYVLSVFAGIFFGLWPLLLNRSGLNGNVASVIFSGISFICIAVFSFAIAKMSIPAHTNWWLAIAAGATSGIGVLIFNNVLAKSSPLNVATLFALTLVVQIVVAAVYQVIVSGNLSIAKGLGFIFAGVTTWLLLKG